MKIKIELNAGIVYNLECLPVVTCTHISQHLSLPLFKFASLQQMPIGLRACRPLPVDLDPAPAVLVVLLLHLAARLEPPVRDADHEAALKHEGAASRADLGRLQLRVARPLVAVRVRAVPAHDVVQARTARHETPRPSLLGVVPALDEPHELAHGVAVVPGGPEGVLADQPARREDDEVGDGGACVVGGGGQHREDARVRVVEADAADGVEAAQVVLVGVVVAVPRDHVEGRVRLHRLVKAVGELGRHRVLVWAVKRHAAAVLVKRSQGRLEVARVGEPVGADGAQLREDKVALVQLQGVAARGARGEVDGELDAARDDGDLHGPDEQPTLLGADVQDALLRDEQEVSICGVEGVLCVHRLCRGEDVNAQPGLDRGVPGAGDQVQPAHKVCVP